MIKSIFNILSVMHDKDIIDNTHLVAIYPDIVSMKKLKDGAEIAIKIPSDTMKDILDDKKFAVLMIIDEHEYYRQLEKGACLSEVDGANTSRKDNTNIPDNQ